MDSEKANLKKTQKAIDKSYKNAMKLYDTQAAELAQLQPQYEQSIMQGYESQKPIIQQQFQTGMENIGLQKEQTGQARETALSSARRQYEQGVQRTQQLFGGVAGSNVGQASSEVLGAEQMRQLGSVQAQSAQAFQQLGTQERDLQATVSNNLQQLEIKKQADLLKLRDSFRQELNQINAQRGALAMNKANAQLQALQDYNNRKRQLEDMATQQRMSIESYAQQLALQARYSGAGSVSQIPNFTTMTDQQRSAAFKNLTSTDAGKRALELSGYELATAAGERILFNPYTGETYNLPGFRYTDFSPVTYQQAVDSTPQGQKPPYSSLLGVPGRIGDKEFK
jgi:hypothetical protein